GAVAGEAVAAGAAEAPASEIQPHIWDAGDARRLGFERSTRLAVARDLGAGDLDVQPVHGREVRDVQAVLGVVRDDAVADLGDELLGRAAAVALADVAA